MQGLTARYAIFLMLPFEINIHHKSSLEDARAFEILTSLVTLHDVPHKLISDLATTLVERAVASEADATALARGRSLLVHIQQRYPEPLQGAFEIALKDPGDKKELLEQLLISLSVELPGVASDPGETSETDIVVASTSADATVRVIAVRELYERLAKDDLSPVESVSCLQLFLALIQLNYCS